MNIPKFDKSVDDRQKNNKWLKVKKPDIVIFEGWCCATAQKNKDLNLPINKLEKHRDKKIWRQRVNFELKNDYKNFNQLIN